MAFLQLNVHVLFDQLHGHMAWTLDHYLHIVLPGNLGQFAQGAKLAQLRLIIGIPNRTGAQAITQREADVVSLHDFANVFEMLIQKAFFVVGQAPLRHD